MKIFLMKSENHDVVMDEVEFVNDPESADVLWFHNIADPRLIQNMLGRVPMIFYGQAVRTVTELLEHRDVTRSCQIVRSEDPWDKRGFQAYKNHPLFENLNGGFYSYLLTSSDHETVFYYDGSLARIIAVEKRYISVMRDNPVVWEYEFNDRKRILCVGGYLNFKSPHMKYCLAEAKLFVNNVLKYLTTVGSKAHFWPICENRTMLNHSLKSLNLIIEPLKEEFVNPSLLIHEGVGTDYTNLCGRRILVNLRENGIFDEIWVHPFRFLKRLNFSIDGRNFSELNVYHKIYADRVIHEADSLRLVSFVSLDKPLAMFQMEFEDDRQHDVKIELESDTRIMWPFDEAFNCGRSFNYYEENGLLLFQTSDGMFSGFLKVNSPIKILWDTTRESLKIELLVSAHRSLSICLAGFIESEEIPDVVDFTQELRNYNLFVKEYLEKTLQIESDHAILDKMFECAKLGTIKFFTAVPSLGEGLMAGYANSKPGWFSARPGYAWYFGRDSEWVSLALLDIGDWVTVKRNLELLMKYQRVDGKIFHELTSSGVVHYDAADSTPLFLLTVHRYWKHTNDVEFLKSIWSNVVKAFEFCLSTDRDQDGLIENKIEGHGWIEGGKLYGSRAELYLNAIWLAATKGMIEMSKTVQDYRTLEKAEQAFLKVESALSKFYDQETGFYILGIRDNGEKLNYLTVMTAVAVYLGSMDFERSKHQVIPYATNDFSTDWGVRIIGKSSGIYNPNGYHEGTVWPLFTGWVSLAEFKVGGSLSGFSHLLSNLSNAKYFAKGYISEVYHGEIYKPSGICPHQAWSESMAIQPLVEGMLGFVADAPNSSVSLSPQFPWNISKFVARNLKVGEVLMNLSFERHEVSKGFWNELYRLDCSKPIRSCLSFWIPKQAYQIEVVVNGSKVNFSTLEGLFATRIDVPEILCSEMSAVVTYRLPFELYAIERDPVPFNPSGKLRLVSMNKLGKVYEILVEASSVGELLKELPSVLKIDDEKVVFKINKVERNGHNLFSITMR
ncbi:amylo-alpha-1,6-glucosidase [Pseudothermotoga sp.]